MPKQCQRGSVSHPTCSALGWLYLQAGTTHGSKMSTRNTSLADPAWGCIFLPFTTFPIVPTEILGLALLGPTAVMWLIPDMSHCGQKMQVRKARLGPRPPWSPGNRVSPASTMGTMGEEQAAPKEHQSAQGGRRGSRCCADALAQIQIMSELLLRGTPLDRATPPGGQTQ